MKGILFLILLYLISAHTVYSGVTYSEDNYFRVKQNLISASAGGTTPGLGISYERYLSDKISAEFGIGSYGLGLGIFYYPKSVINRKFLFHTGLTYVDYYKGDNKFIVYSPIGINYTYKNVVSLGIDIGPAYIDDFFASYGNMKVGVRF